MRSIAGKTGRREFENYFLIMLPSEASDLPANVLNCEGYHLNTILKFSKRGVSRLGTAKTLFAKSLMSI